MQQSIHYWNIHNKVSIDLFIQDLITQGNSIVSTMATAYHENQVIRAVIVTEQDRDNPDTKRSVIITDVHDLDIATMKVTFQNGRAYYKISGKSIGGWINIDSIKSITT